MMRPLLLLSVVTLALSCGGGGGSDNGGYNTPPPATVTWDQVKSIIDANCARCHNGSTEPKLTPEATFRASPVKAKLDAGAMPPPPALLSGADKQALLSFLR